MGQLTYAPLTAHHSAELDTFCCRGFRQPWTDIVEEMIRERLADSLAEAAVVAEGAWSDADLAGLIAWSRDESRHLAKVSVVAVNDGFHRRGIATSLKQRLLRHAAASGLRYVSSVVHVDNEPMWKLNASLGGEWIRPTSPVDPYWTCVVETAAWSGGRGDLGAPPAS